MIACRPVARWLALGAITVIGCAQGTAPDAPTAPHSEEECSVGPGFATPISVASPNPSASDRVPEAPARSIHPVDEFAAIPALREGVIPGHEVELRVPGDRPAIVIHAPAGNRQALVYLHGVCGDVYAIRSWATAASRYGTLVALLGDDACKAPKGRFRWSRDADRLNTRIQRTLEVVAAARGGQLDLERITIIGYSQGADRAERIASRHYRRYPRVLLGSPPEAPGTEFGAGQAVAVVAGARENNDERRQGVDALTRAGLPSVFIPLPDAYHGQYGPDGARVMDDALAWLFQHTELDAPN